MNRIKRYLQLRKAAKICNMVDGLDLSTYLRTHEDITVEFYDWEFNVRITHQEHGIVFDVKDYKWNTLRKVLVFRDGQWTKDILALYNPNLEPLDESI